MGKKKPPQSNSWADEDFQQILDEIEELEAEKVSIMAKAAGDCGGIAKKIKTAKATAKDLGIPLSILGATLKTRKYERKIEEIAKGVPDDQVELFMDAMGQFSWLKPEETGESGAQVAAKRAKTSADANQEAEQRDGAEVLADLIKVH